MMVTSYGTAGTKCRPQVAVGTLLSVVLSVIACCTCRVTAQSPCGEELTDSYGVVLSPGYPQTYPRSVNCEWHIAPNVTDTNSSVTGLTLQFRSFQTLDGGGGQPSGCALETLCVYTSDPANSTEPVNRFSGKELITQSVTFTGTQLWLRFSSASSRPGTDTLAFRIVYWTNGANIRCDADPLPNGRILNENDSLDLDSTATFRCDFGFRMEGPGSATCRLIDNPLTVTPGWSQLPTCLSTCLPPDDLGNGTYVTNSSTFSVNSSVTYACSGPYRLRGGNVITCTLNSQGVPQWSGAPPTCSIPTCDTPLTFTDPAGVLVSPSYPRQFLAANKNCVWNLRVQPGKVVRFNISYFDVAAQGELAIRDGVTKRQLRLLQGGESHMDNEVLLSSGSSVEVVYNGPPVNSSKHRGFYIIYSSVEPARPPPQPSTFTTPISTSPTATRMLTSSVNSGTTSDKVGVSAPADSGSAGKIAAGVTVPLILLLLIGGVAYWCYRKRYPVRMIMGRDFGKFSNPEYRTPSTLHTLVREDAEEFFQQTQPSGQVNLVIGDGEEGKAQYVNVAFEYDSQDADEEEVERRFRERKAYLFKKDDDQSSADPEEGSQLDSLDGGTDSAGRTAQTAQGEGHVNLAFSDDSDAADGDDRKVTQSGKDNNSDSESASSDASSSCDKDGTPSSLEQGKPTDEGALPCEDNSPARHDAGREDGQVMTVREFLRLKSKEKRALSDVTRFRAGSLTSFDVKKSARKRAQSAEDIWTKAGLFSPEPFTEVADLSTSNAAPTPPVDITRSVQETNDMHLTYENLTQQTYENLTQQTDESVSPADVTTNGKPIEDSDNPPGYTSVLTAGKTEESPDDKQNATTSHENASINHENATTSHENETTSHENETTSHENAPISHENATSSHENATSSYENVDEEVLAVAGQDRGPDRNRSPSSSSCSSYEQVASPFQAQSSAEIRAGSQVTAPPAMMSDQTGVSALRSLSATDSDSALDPDVEAASDSPDRDMEPDIGKVDHLSSAVLPFVTDVADDVQQTSVASDRDSDSSPPEDLTYMNVEPGAPGGRLDDMSSTAEMTAVGEPSTDHTQPSSCTTSAGTHEPRDGAGGQEYSSDISQFEMSGNVEDKNVSFPRDLPVQLGSEADKSAVQETSDTASIKAHSSSHGSSISIEHIPSDSDGQQDGECGDGQMSDWELIGQTVVGKEPRAVISAQGLSPLFHSLSTTKSPSSDDSDDDKERESSDLHGDGEPRPLQFVTTRSAAVAESGPAAPLEPQLSASLQTVTSNDSELTSPATQPMHSPPQPTRPRGLAALKTHPDAIRTASESDSEDLEFTAEDIQEALMDSSDEGSQEESGPRSLQISSGSAPLKIKIQPEDNVFVFSEGDCEDVDV